MLNPFQRFRTNRAARRYARLLPAGLRSGWGRSEFYTTGQIEAATRKLGLDSKFIVFGYAAFLPKESFDAQKEKMPVLISYEEARSMVMRHLVSRGDNPWEPAGINSFIAQGGTGRE